MIDGRVVISRHVVGRILSCIGIPVFHTVSQKNCTILFSNNFINLSSGLIIIFGTRVLQ